jgi:hypothetical protein
LKTAKRDERFVGSNPTLSSRKSNNHGLFLILEANADEWLLRLPNFAFAARMLLAGPHRQQQVVKLVSEAAIDSQ